MLQSKFAQNPQLAVTTLCEYARARNRSDEWVGYVKRLHADSEKNGTSVGSGVIEKKVR